MPQLQGVFLFEPSVGEMLQTTKNYVTFITQFTVFQIRKGSQVKNPRKLVSKSDKIKLMVNLKRWGKTHIS